MGDGSDQRVAKALMGFRLINPNDPSGENGIIAKDTLHDELGFHGEKERHAPYGLDDRTRDEILAHGRQDIAHGLLNTIVLLREATAMRGEVVALRRQVRALTALVGLVVVMVLGVVLLAAWSLGFVR